MSDYPTPGQHEFSAEEEKAMRTRTPATAVNDTEQSSFNLVQQIGRGQSNLSRRALELEGRRRGGFPR